MHKQTSNLLNALTEIVHTCGKHKNIVVIKSHKCILNEIKYYEQLHMNIEYEMACLLA